MPLTKREEIFIEKQLRKKIPSIKPAGRGFIFREFEMQELIAFIYELIKKAERQGRENAKKNLEKKMIEIIKKELS